MAIDSQVCLHRWDFANPVKLSCCITGPAGPLGSTNQNWLGAKILLMALLIYPVVYVHSCCLLRAQQHCLQLNNREGLPLACPPTSTTCPPPPTYLPPPTHPPLPICLISATHDITGVVKNYLKNQQWILYSRVSYETLAISLLYLYSKACMVVLCHRRATVT